MDIRELVEKFIKPSYEYEIYEEASSKESIEVSDGKLENFLRAKDWGVGIRVIKGNKMGFAYTTEKSPSAIKECVERAMEICELTPEDEGYTFNCQKASLEEPFIYDQEGKSMKDQEKIELVLSIENSIRALDDRIKGVRKVSLKEKELEVHYYNSCGLEHSYKTTFYTSFASALAEHKGDASISYDFRGARRLRDLDLEGMARDVVFKATSLLHPEPYETKAVPVLIFRDAMAMLLETFSVVFSGEYLLKEKTLLRGKVGEVIASELISIIDDGTLKDGFMSFPFDAEGIKTSRKVLVDKGVLKGFIHSLYTAKKLKEEPTGNSVRESFRALPSCQVSNFYIEAGDKELEELLSAYDEVFLVLDLMGLHTADPVSGDFSLGASGIIYKKGKKDKSVRGLTISGNVLELLKSVKGVGKDFTFYANVGSPSLLVEKLTVGG